MYHYDTEKRAIIISKRTHRCKTSVSSSVQAAINATELQHTPVLDVSLQHTPVLDVSLQHTPVLDVSLQHTPVLDA